MKLATLPFNVPIRFALSTDNVLAVASNTKFALPTNVLEALAKTICVFDKFVSTMLPAVNVLATTTLLLKLIPAAFEVIC